MSISIAIYMFNGQYDASTLANIMIYTWIFQKAFDKTPNIRRRKRNKAGVESSEMDRKAVK